MDADNFVEFVKSRRWTYARTMLQCPHEYAVREWEPDRQQEFEEVALFIRERGKPEPYFSKIHIYYYADGWKYWTMGAPIPETTVINRAK
ncbi:MAG: hypothetical protein WCP36_09890 [Methanomicrobiales archaeon]